MFFDIMHDKGLVTPDKLLLKSRKKCLFSETIPVSRLYNHDSESILIIKSNFVHVKCITLKELESCPSNSYQETVRKIIKCILQRK